MYVYGKESVTTGYHRRLLEITGVYWRLLLPKEVGLLGLAEAADTDVRQELLLENVLGVLDPLFPSDSRLGSSHTNEVLGHLLLLDDKGLVQRRLQLKAGSGERGVSGRETRGRREWKGRREGGGSGERGVSERETRGRRGKRVMSNTAVEPSVVWLLSNVAVVASVLVNGMTVVTPVSQTNEIYIIICHQLMIFIGHLNASYRHHKCTAHFKVHIFFECVESFSSNHLPSVKAYTCWRQHRDVLILDSDWASSHPHDPN